MNLGMSIKMSKKILFYNHFKSFYSNDVLIPVLIKKNFINAMIQVQNSIFRSLNP